MSFGDIIKLLEEDIGHILQDTNVGTDLPEKNPEARAGIILSYEAPAL